MKQEISISELQGMIEGIKFTQLSLLMELGVQADLNLHQVASAARGLSRTSSAQGEALRAMHAYLDAIDALAKLPK